MAKPSVANYMLINETLIKLEINWHAGKKTEEPIRAYHVTTTQIRGMSREIATLVQWWFLDVHVHVHVHVLARISGCMKEVDNHGVCWCVANVDWIRQVDGSFQPFGEKVFG